MAEEVEITCPLLVNVITVATPVNFYASFEYNGQVNGKPSYIGEIEGTTLYVYFFAGIWILGENTTGTSGIWAEQDPVNVFDYPLGSFDTILEETLLEFNAKSIECPCPCIKITVIATEEGGDPVTLVYDVESTELFDGFYAYTIPDFFIPPSCDLAYSEGFGPATVYLWQGGRGWEITSDYYGGKEGLITSKKVSACPSGVWRNSACLFIEIEATACQLPCLQDRTFRKYDSIKLPEVFDEPERGYMRCCCEFMVMANGSSSSFENDVTSAWIKLSSGTDVANLTIKKNGVAIAYSPASNNFPNEPFAQYWTIEWASVLAASGQGKYCVEISYSISGISQTFIWGVYNLTAYTVENALYTARVRAIFNSYHEIEAIDFTGADVDDSLRFYGFIGNRQPNTEIDNLIYQNREMKSVIRENLNTYEILVDPTCDEHIRKLTDLLLLSENDLFISDYNSHNHSYRYQDLPVIVEESPEVEYYQFSREAGLKCVVSDKFKNKRTFYK